MIRMADLLDTSVDVLLGYEVKDNRLEATVKRLQEYRRSKDWDGLMDAEKALWKDLHSLQIVHESAALYRAFGVDSGGKALFCRALELLEQSRLLLLRTKTRRSVSRRSAGGSRKRIRGRAKRTRPQRFGKAITQTACTAPGSCPRSPLAITPRRRSGFCRRPSGSMSPN